METRSSTSSSWTKIAQRLSFNFVIKLGLYEAVFLLVIYVCKEYLFSSLSSGEFGNTIWYENDYRFTQHHWYVIEKETGFEKPL